MPGELEKLRVEAYRDEQRQGDPVAVFEVQFNPNAYARAQEIEFESESGAGNTAGPARFKRYKAQDCTLEFTLDGTGASGTVIEVEDQVQAFLKVAAEMDGEIHRPPFLIVSWGTLVLKCVLKSASVNYTLFKPGGQPLRAKVSAVFSESIDEQLRTAEENKSSPDRTRAWLVQRGDNLPKIAFEHYGDPALFTAVARHNDLDHLRAFEPGQSLRLPPKDQLPLTTDADA
ncbi:MAG: hypothetical protein H7A45_20300 [Verrucomicrobiales bacterium]|nr:hypothetical protein [Verrucomicrobiales bacterium]MCP5527849.1 hypothetical protein [Verrucomicrobiales bacterium]